MSKDVLVNALNDAGATPDQKVNDKAAESA
jgi:hypothetical protein